jgi:uncharacterized hydrophobic protein (TIGR00271 family)
VLHLRLLVPGALTAAVLAVLRGRTGVTGLVVHAGVLGDPDGDGRGDVVEVDLAREIGDDVLDDLVALGLERSGSITVDETQLVISAAADTAQREAPGNAVDALVWREVEERTGRDATLTGTFLGFLTIATLLAGIGIVQDSAVLVVGAMVLGPEFGPQSAIAVGLARRRPGLIRRGLVTLVLGFVLAMLATVAGAWIGARVGLLPPDVLEQNGQTDFIYAPGVLSFVVAVLAGTAGVLSLLSRQSTALVGVFISVTTVPAAGWVAVGTVLGEWDQVRGSLLQLVINLAGIVMAATSTLLIRGAVNRRILRRRRTRFSTR